MLKLGEGMVGFRPPNELDLTFQNPNCGAKLIENCGRRRGHRTDRRDRHE